jgi:hypothetical protein
MQITPNRINITANRGTISPNGVRIDLMKRLKQLQMTSPGTGIKSIGFWRLKILAGTAWVKNFGGSNTG